MAFESKELFDAIADFPQGTNSGIAPLKVPRTQLAYLENGTVRGTFAGTRSAFRKMTLDFGGDGDMQTRMELGLFQGCCYYKPDFGLESLLAQISGRLFQFQISGRNAIVFDQSIVGDLNSATLPTAWLWQAEKWSIVNDGQNLPIFFDGNASRRSGGTGVTNTVGGGGFTAPIIGSTVNATFGSTFSGPFNTPLLISAGVGSTTKYLFQVVNTGTGFTGYPVTIKNLNDTGATQAVDSEVLVVNPTVGIIQTTVNVAAASSFTSFTIELTAPPTVPIGTAIGVPITTGTVTDYKSATLTSISGNTIVATLTTTYLSGPFGAQIRATNAVTTPNGSSTLVAELEVALTVPAIGSSTTAYLDRPYTGGLPQIVYINGDQFQITAVITPGANTAVVLLNINAPTTVGLFAVGSTVSGVNELPAGKMGVYGMSRDWMSLTDGRSFIASDIVGGSSGTLAYQFRDSVLKITENAYLNGGGVFIVPGQVGEIRAMIFTANLDKALGQGPLMVYTPTIAFSCNAPVDRTTWQDLTNPILSESMKGGGAQGQDSTTLANSDVISRDANGIRSLILGRREFNTWGNVPISQEVRPILDEDEKSLLPFGSAVEFDNRLLMTVDPNPSNFGPYHTKLVAINFDPISSMQGKAPSVYDGVWTGLNVLKLLKGSFNGTDRSFAFCVSEDLDKIELWEILPSEGPDSESTDEGDEPIVMKAESGSLNFHQNDPRTRQLLCLMDGEIFVDNISSAVTFAAYYKPDQWPNWVPWFTWTEPFDANTDPGFRPRMGLGEPSPDAVDESVNNRPLREAYTYQVKLVITGKCRFLGARFKAVTRPQSTFAVPKADGTTEFTETV